MTDINWKVTSTWKVFKATGMDEQKRGLRPKELVNLKVKYKRS